MKKVFLLLITISLFSCESKFEKSVKDLEGNIWIADYEKDVFSYNSNSKVTNVSDKIIYRFTGGNIYMFDLNGEPKEMFGYEKVNDNGHLKLIIENIYSHKKENYSVAVSENDLIMITSNNGNIIQINYDLLRDSLLISKIIGK